MDELEKIRRMIAADDDGTFNLLRDVFVGRYGRRHELTPPELRCLSATAVGLRAKEAGMVLGIAEETVKSHLSSARLKLRGKNTCHAVALAIRAGLI